MQRATRAGGNVEARRSGWIYCGSISARVFLAVFGGYAVSAAVVTALAATLALTGMARGEAIVLAIMLGFIIYLMLLLWAFAARQLAPLAVAFVLIGSVSVGTVLLAQQTTG